MIKLNKFEILGIGVSVGLMAATLFLLRWGDVLDGMGASVTQSASQNGSQAAAVVVTENDPDGIGEALQSAMTGSKVEKLVITDVVLGWGEEVEEGDMVEVNYIGTLQNGQEFDNSYKKGSTFTFTVGAGKVIKGWEEGVLGMKVGGQRILIVPAHLAYGAEGYGPIPGKATLVFAIELVSIKK